MDGRGEELEDEVWKRELEKMDTHCGPKVHVS